MTDRDIANQLLELQRRARELSRRREALRNPLINIGALMSLSYAFSAYGVLALDESANHLVASTSGLLLVLAAYAKKA